MERSESAPATCSHIRPYQFSLRAALIAVTDVAVFLSFVTWLGKDGILLAAVALPIISVPTLAKGPAKRRARITAAATLLTTGIAWTILFPKTWDVFRPDTFDSILIGVALIGGGTLLLWQSRKVTLMLLWIALLWSALLNLSLLNHYRVMALFIQDAMSRW